MTKLYHFLYKKMADDLKDAGMLIDYACELKSEGCEDVAKYFAENAVYRLSKSFKEAHTLFETHASKEAGFSGDTVTHCLWDLRHEEMMECYEELAKKIEKFK